MVTTRVAAPAPEITDLRVLLVDGSARTCRRLRRGLRGRSGWRLELARSVDAAVAAVGQGSFDVVISEVRPRKGLVPDLLRQVKAAAPGSVRLLLADEVEVGGPLARLAHQVLPTGVAPEDLADTIAQVAGVLALLARDDLREVVTEVDRLPGAPTLHLELSRLTEDPDVELAAVAAVVGKDPAIASKILQLVNSAFFGRSVRTADLTEATAFLGITALRGLVLQNELMRTFRSSDATRNRFLEDFVRHGYDVALGARDLAPPGLESDAFTAGLLHDVGQVVIASRRPYEWERIRAEVAATRAPLPDVERAHLGASHAEIGAALLALWALPYPVVEAVAHHHQPREVGVRFGLTGAVHVADARQNDGGHGPSFDHGTELDREWVARVAPDLAPDA